MATKGTKYTKTQTQYNLKDFYECSLCGLRFKDNGNVIKAVEKDISCGRSVVLEHKYFCSKNCGLFYQKDHLMGGLKHRVEECEERLESTKHYISTFVKSGKPIPKWVLSVSKLQHIQKKLYGYLLEGKLALAYKLFHDKKEIITEELELVLEENDKLYLKLIDDVKDMEVAIDALESGVRLKSGN